ncbi:MAG: GRAS family protein [Kofleriaceae bacterium]|nr:GRAS family protein [Kofleriaceae bacterium]
MQTAAASLAPRLDPASAAHRIDVLFEQALGVREAKLGIGAGNLYGGKAGPEAMLSAFRLLIQETPLVRFGHLGANRAIDGATFCSSAIHIVDLGIGHGLQWDDLLVLLALRPVRPRVRITGVDLPSAGASPTEALERTGARLAALAAQVGIDFEFEAIAGAIEDLERPRSRAGEKLIVNAALALHHVADGDAVTDPARSRDALLRRIATWSPSLVTLIEPDAAHNSLPFEQRVREARRHYGLVFDVFAHLFPQDQEERRTLEREFFGSEILNVVASEGPARVERHDRIETWCRRMTDAGFEARSLRMVAASHARELDLRGPFTVESRGPALALCFGGESIIGVSAWTAGTVSTSPT